MHFTNGGADVTQHEEIIKFMQEYGSISPMEAFAELGITKLATRISELIRGGCEIRKTRITKKNRYGRTVTYMRYSLEV